MGFILWTVFYWAYSDGNVAAYGIDAPEQDQPYGSVAAKALVDLVGDSAYMIQVDEDRYGRVVGRLFNAEEGYDINAAMVCAGDAWWYERYAPDSQVLEDCHVEAQQASKGLWEDDDPVPPWEWRQK